MTTRDLALGGAFGAAGLLLPVFFHLVHLGAAFSPMVLPLVTLGFVARPGVASATGLIVPLLSALLTGMPPLYPPIAPIMSVEIAAMAGSIGLIRRWRPGLSTYVVLVPVLVAGRALSFGLTWLVAGVMSLPQAFVAGISFISGWPGFLLMIAVIPPLVGLLRGTPQSSSSRGSSENESR